VQPRPRVSQHIAAQVRARGSARPKRLATTAARPVERKPQRASVVSPRECEGCGADIGGRPASHRRCLACFRSSQDSPSDADEDACERCGRDISDRPPTPRATASASTASLGTPGLEADVRTGASRASPAKERTRWRTPQRTPQRSGDFCNHGSARKRARPSTRTSTANINHEAKARTKAGERDMW
jgi:hypothetical protein